MIFRPNTLDELIYNAVVKQNEYRLPARFDPADVIIDIGAHIGCFAKACLDRGAKHVYCWEPDAQNYEILSLHIESGELKGVEAFNSAVWRDDAQRVRLLHNGYALRPQGDINTGSGSVLGVTGIPVDWNRVSDVVARACSDPPVTMSSHSVRLIKLDCEGSEFPILLSVSDLSMVEEICGEYHVAPITNFDHKELEQCLQGHGFATEFTVPTPEGLGMFWARRPK